MQIVKLFCDEYTAYIDILVPKYTSPIYACSVAYELRQVSVYISLPKLKVIINPSVMNHRDQRNNLQYKSCKTSHNQSSIVLAR